MASLLPHSPSLLLSPFPTRARSPNPLLHRSLLLSHHQSLLRGSLCVARFGFQPDPEAAEVVVRDLFGRAEGLLYTLADAAVASSDSVTTATDGATAVKQNSDWFSGIANYMETVLKVLESGLSKVHVPYAYGFAIILLTVLVKAATFPLTKKQVESAMAMRSMQPQIKAIQQRYAGNQERIQIETARLYKLAGINPLAGCLPTLATIPVWIGLYRALSNVANEGLLTEGFFWIPSLAGPTTVAAQQNGSGISWLFPFVDGHPPLGWTDTLAYLVLPVLLVVSQFISIEIMQSSQPQSDDPNMKNSQALTKILPFMIGYFALSVPSGLSLYWLTNNILSTAQQVWLQKLGGAKNPFNQISNDIGKNPLDQISDDAQSQIPNSVFQANSTLKEAKKEVKSASEGPRPGERFKMLKEQEARRKQQREEEKRKAEEATAQASQITGDGNEKEANLVQTSIGAGTNLIDERNTAVQSVTTIHETSDRLSNAELSEHTEVNGKDEQHSHESTKKPSFARLRGVERSYKDNQITTQSLGFTC